MDWYTPALYLPPFSLHQFCQLTKRATNAEPPFHPVHDNRVVADVCVIYLFILVMTGTQSVTSAQARSHKTK